MKEIKEEEKEEVQVPKTVMKVEDIERKKEESRRE